MHADSKRAKSTAIGVATAAKVGRVGRGRLGLVGGAPTLLIRRVLSHGALRAETRFLLRRAWLLTADPLLAI